MARYHYIDIDFPDEKHYKNVKENLKKEYIDSQAANGIILSPKSDEDIRSDGVFNVHTMSERRNSIYKKQE